MTNAETKQQGGLAERSFRALRNLNLGIGAVVLAGVALIPPLAVVAAPVAVFGGVGAGVSEVLRDAAKHRRNSNVHAHK